MTKTELRRTRAALELLNGVGAAGMTREFFAQFLRDEVPDALSDQDVDDLLKSLQEREWVKSYTNPISEQVRYILTAKGQGARAAL